MSNVIVDKSKIDVLANAISIKSGEPVTMTLDEMVEAVDGIEANPTLQNKSVVYDNPGPNTLKDTVVADGGYDGLGKVDISVTGAAGATTSLTHSKGYLTESGIRKWEFRPILKVTKGGWVPQGTTNGQYIQFSAIGTGSVITPSKTAQTIGGANYMMEGPVTVSAVPMADAGPAWGTETFITESGVRKFRYEYEAYAESEGWVDEGGLGDPTWVEWTAVPSNTTVTPTESAQTVGGTKYMMEGAVTVSAIPSNYVGSGVTQRSSTDLTASGATVTAPAGYYESGATKTVASGTEGTPTATKGTVANNSVTVTPSVTNSSGYIPGGTHTGTAVTVTASELVSGSQTISTNGTVDVTNLEEVVVSVSGGSSEVYVGATPVTLDEDAYVTLKSETSTSYSYTVTDKTFADRENVSYSNVTMSEEDGYFELTRTGSGVWYLDAMIMWFRGLVVGATYTITIVPYDAELRETAGGYWQFLDSNNETVVNIGVYAMPQTATFVAPTTDIYLELCPTDSYMSGTLGFTKARFISMTITHAETGTFTTEQSLGHLTAGTTISSNPSCGVYAILTGGSGLKTQVIFPEQSVTATTTEQSGYSANISVSENITNGANYIVTMDGTAYLCYGKQLYGNNDVYCGDDTVILGNPANARYPFMVATWGNGTTAWGVANNTAHTVKIEKVLSFDSAELGTKTITTNGTYSAEDDGYDGYSEVTVNVSGSSPTIQSLTVTPSTSQQTFNASGVDGYKPVTVNAIPSQYIVPTGNKAITENGNNIDVAQYSTVSVNVSGGSVNIGTVTTTNSSNQNTSISFTLPSGRTPKAFFCRLTSQIARNSSSRYYYCYDMRWDGSSNGGVAGNTFYMSSGTLTNVTSGYSKSQSNTTFTLSSTGSRSTSPGSFYNGTYELVYVY